MTGRDLVTIRVVAEYCGVKQHVVRRWTDIGLLRCQRSPGGTRLFDMAVVRQAHAVGDLRGGGYRRPAVQRIWAQVVQDGSGCWTFTGGLTGGGYGQVRADDRGQGTHRVMFEAVMGPVPAELDLDHLCRNRACCNPAHLEPVTTRVNLLRGTGFSARNAVKTHCIHGHEFTEANTMREKYGRKCRTCHNAHEAARRARQHALAPAAVRQWHAAPAKAAS